MHLPTSAPEFSSARWAAHNAALRAKRAKSREERPKIGSAYVPPPPRITPAIEVPKREEIVPRWYVMIGWCLALLGFIAVMITLVTLGRISLA